MPSSTLTNHQSTPENPPSLWAPASSVTNRMPSSWPANDHIGGVAFSVGGVGANGSVKQCLCICVWLPVVGPESAATSHRCPIPRPAGLTSTAACAVLADVGVPAAAHDLNQLPLTRRTRRPDLCAHLTRTTDLLLAHFAGAFVAMKKIRIEVSQRASSPRA